MKREEAGFGAIVAGAIASKVLDKMLEKAEDEIIPADGTLNVEVPAGAEAESITTSKAEEMEARRIGVVGNDVLRVHEVEPLPDIAGFLRIIRVMGEESDEWNDAYFSMLYFRSSSMNVGMSRIYQTARQVFSTDSPMYKVLNILQYHRNLEADPNEYTQESFDSIKPYKLGADDDDFKNRFINEMQRAFGALPLTMRRGLIGSDAKLGLGDDYTSIPREKVTSHIINLTQNGLLDIATRIEALYRGFRGNKKASGVPPTVYRLEITAPEKDKDGKTTGPTKTSYVKIDDFYVQEAVPKTADDAKNDSEVGQLNIGYRKMVLHEYVTESGGSEYMHSSDALAELGNVTVSEDNEWLDVLDNVNIFIKAGLDPMTYMNTLAYPRGCAINAIVKRWKKSAGREFLSAKMIDELFT